MQSWLPQFRDLLIRFAAKYPVPTTGEEAAREWIKKVAETFNYHFPVFGSWGVKSSSPTNPQTADCLTLKSTVALTGFDTLRSAGDPDCQLISSPGPIDLNGQYFIPVVAKDWLGYVPDPIPTPTPTPTPIPVPEVTLVEVNAKCQLILEILQKHFK